jgi:hypothetical protein
MRKGDLVAPSFLRGRSVIERADRDEMFRLGVIAKSTLESPGLIAVYDISSGKRMILPISELRIVSRAKRERDEVRENIISKISSGDQA